jgi:hypothetical protein
MKMHRRMLLVVAAALAASPVVASAQTLLFNETFEDGNGASRWTTVLREASVDPAVATPDASIDYNTDISTLVYSLAGVDTPVPAPASGGTKVAMVKANNTAPGAQAIGQMLSNTGVTGDYKMSVDVFTSFGTGGTTEFIMFGLNYDGAGVTGVTLPVPTGTTAPHYNTRANGYAFALTPDGGAAGDYRVYATDANDDGPRFQKRNATWTGTSPHKPYNEAGLVTGNSPVLPEEVFTGNRYWQEEVFPTSDGWELDGNPQKQWYNVEIIQRGRITHWVLNGKIGMTLFNSEPRSGKVMLGAWDAFNSVGTPEPLDYHLFDNINVSTYGTATPNVIGADSYALFNSSTASNGAGALTSLAIESGSSVDLSGTGALTIGGEGYGAILADGAAHTISKPLALAADTGIYIGEGASLTINAVSGGSNVDINKTGRGTLTLGSGVEGKSLTVSAGRVNLGGTTKVEQLWLFYQPAADATPPFALSPDSGILDLGTSAVAVDYINRGVDPAAAEGTTNSPLQQLARYLNTGFNEGLWDGPGMVSSALPGGDPSFFIRLVEASTLGYADGATWIDGVTIDTTTVLVGYTYIVDANFNQAVDFADLLVVAQNYDPNFDPVANPPKQWYQGDFTNDGIVGFDDLLALAQLYGSALLQGHSVTNPELANQFEHHWGLARSVIPEPATLGLLAGAGLLALRRR